MVGRFIGRFDTPKGASAYPCLGVYLEYLALNRLEFVHFFCDISIPLNIISDSQLSYSYYFCIDAVGYFKINLYYEFHYENLKIKYRNLRGEQMICIGSVDLLMSF